MAIQRCLNPDTTAQYDEVDVDESAPGAWAGRTLQCRTGQTDGFGDPLYASVSFTEPVPEPPPAPPVSAAAQRVADFLGQGDDPELLALAAQHVAIISSMVRSYTRGGGFYGTEPTEDVAAVITCATARLLANPEQLRTQVGSQSVYNGFSGWSLAESFVLNRYRKRAS